MESLRSLEDVEEIMGFAKLERKELLSTVQCLKFKPQLDSDSVRLLEVDNNVLDALENGDRVILRGNKADQVVLCTTDRTYEVKDAETSNNLLLLDDCKMPDELKQTADVAIRHIMVGCMKQGFLEAKVTRPQLSRLRQRLEENTFNGLECEEDENHRGKKYAFEDILDCVQASEKEITEALRKLKAVLISGFWRLLDFDYEGKLLQSILNLIDEESWNINDVPLKTTCDILEDVYPRKVIAHVLACFSHEPTIEDLEKPEAEQTYHISEDKVCRYFAEMVLKPVGRFHFGEFEKVWQLSVPEGMKTAEYQIKGLALIDRDSTPQVIKYFAAADLSENIQARFDELFNVKPKWTLEDITPYIQDLATEKIGVGALLAKNTRSSTQMGMKLFSSKKLK